MTSQSKDQDYVAHRYVNIEDENEFVFWYDRKDIDENTPTECFMCSEAENGMHTKYAHPKAHLEAHTKANIYAENKATEENKKEYIDYYMFFYRMKYTTVYNALYKKYREEYQETLLKNHYALGQICSYHSESVIYYHENCKE